MKISIDGESLLWDFDNSRISKSPVPPANQRLEKSSLNGRQIEIKPYIYSG
ncbi:MAG: hypothetical protein LBU32_17050 [Clostridiales bacterium]|nr:hypothetical protein [Clostridiales bacterium]